MKFTEEVYQMRDVSDCDVETIIEDLVSRDCGVLISVGEWDMSFLNPSNHIYVQINFNCPLDVEREDFTDEPAGDASGTDLLKVLRIAYERAMRSLDTCAFREREAAEEDEE